jgi:hypothetical protein
MRLLKLLILLISFTCTYGYAQDSEYIKSIYVKAILEDGVKQTITLDREVAANISFAFFKEQQKSSGISWPPEALAEAEKLFRDAFLSSTDKMMQLYKEFYMNTFDQKELEEIIKFNGSPIGKKLAARSQEFGIRYLAHRSAIQTKNIDPIINAKLKAIVAKYNIGTPIPKSPESKIEPMGRRLDITDEAISRYVEQLADSSNIIFQERSLINAWDRLKLLESTLSSCQYELSEPESSPQFKNNPEALASKLGFCIAAEAYGYLRNKQLIANGGTGRTMLAENTWNIRMAKLIKVGNLSEPEKDELFLKVSSELIRRGLLKR